MRNPALMSDAEQDYWTEYANRERTRVSRHWRVRTALTEHDVRELRRIAECAVYSTADGAILAFHRGDGESHEWMRHAVCAALRREVELETSSHLEMLRDAWTAPPRVVVRLP